MEIVSARDRNTIPRRTKQKNTLTTQDLVEPSHSAVREVPYEVQSGIAEMVGSLNARV